MSIKERIKKILKPRLKLEPGTRATSFLFIATSIAIAAGILIAANMYYNIDTGEIIVEEAQRVTQILRAVGGLVVGGTSLTSGYQFEVVGSSKLATTTIAAGPLTLSAANQELRFTGGTSYYVGIKAPTGLTQTTIYTLPGSYPVGSGYVLTSDTSGNLSWVAAGTGGIGDVTAVGDCVSGDCFTTGGPTSTTLWFKTGSTIKALTIAGTENATYTLPAVPAGTYYFALTSGTLTSGRIPIVTDAYTIGDSANLTFDTGNRILTIGSSNNTGQLRIYSNNANYISFAATSSLGSSVTYYWPAAPGAAGQVLASDASGNLYWLDLEAAGYGDILAVGDCASGECFTGTSGSTLWFKSGSYTGALTIGALSANATYTLPAVPAGTYYFALATTTFPAGQLAVWAGNYQISGTDVLTISGDSVLYKSNYPLAQSGKQVLREVIPILGFDLPFRCSSACNTATTVSRTIEDYPFSSPETGATRVHKFIIRYADQGTTTPSTWIVWNETDSTTTATFTVPSTNSDLSKGKVYITGNVSIPGAGKRWHLRLQTPSGMTIQVYDIMLAAYDQLP